MKVLTDDGNLSFVCGYFLPNANIFLILVINSSFRWFVFLFLFRIYSWVAFNRICLHVSPRIGLLNFAKSQIPPFVVWFGGIFLCFGQIIFYNFCHFAMMCWRLLRYYFNNWADNTKWQSIYNKKFNFYLLFNHRKFATSALLFLLLHTLS